ncbi:MAG: cysteine synthase family protein [Dehalococcoidia bacterium]
MPEIHEHSRQEGDVFTAIGGTPLVELTRATRPPGMRIFAKLEGGNPTGSIKDRIVFHMLAHARADGRLLPGQPIVEASTGNTGIALAMIAHRFGHPVEVVLPQNAYPPITRLLTLYGAKLSWTPAQHGVAGALERARERAADSGAYFLDQFHDVTNCDTHYQTTGPEIWAQLPQADVFVAGIGTGGTLMGAGRYLKERNPALRIVAAEAHPASQVQGLASFAEGFLPPLLDFSLLDAKILVRSADAFRAARELVSREGIFGGVSAGAVLHVARVYAQRSGAHPDKPLNVVCVFADAGWKYLDSHLWVRDPAPDEDLESTVWW